MRPNQQVVLHSITYDDVFTGVQQTSPTVWTSTNGAMVSLTPNMDTTACTVTPLGPQGEVRVFATTQAFTIGLQGPQGVQLSRGVQFDIVVPYGVPVLLGIIVDPLTP